VNAPRTPKVGSKQMLGFRKWFALAPIALSIAVIGCRDVPTIWRSELKSPDGAWVAIAHTEQDGGFGSAWIGTSVDLESTNGTVNRGKPFKVLDFDCPGPAAHAYVMDDANAGGTINLHMKWLDPSHLKVTYNGGATVNLQVVKLAGVIISLDVVN
jgi:hypothetical protein